MANQHVERLAYNVFSLCRVFQTFRLAAFSQRFRMQNMYVCTIERIVHTIRFVSCRRKQMVKFVVCTHRKARGK